MAGSKEDTSTKVVKAVAGMAAGFGARKVMIFVIKKVTGREPPERPEDLQVGLGEALVWSLVVGAAVQAARLLAVREAARRFGKTADEIVE
jgi:hypothetical protein